MKRYRYGFCIAVFFIFAVSCQQISDFLEQPANKTILITDSDPSDPTSIRRINGKDVFLALLESKPDLSAINASALIKSVYSIGKVTGNKIDLRLHHEGVDYWSGSGDYWVIFAQLENDNRISRAYASKNRKNFHSQRTYLTNTDFMAPVDVDIDINGVLPF
jgi:hypothetical protein